MVRSPFFNRRCSRSTNSTVGNEKEAGQGVKRAIDEGLVKREDLFITSKLWNTFHEGDKVKPIAKKQLADWGLEYFDLFLIHFRKPDPLLRAHAGSYSDALQLFPSPTSTRRFATHQGGPTMERKTTD